MLYVKLCVNWWIWFIIERLFGLIVGWFGYFKIFLKEKIVVMWLFGFMVMFK